LGNIEHNPISHKFPSTLCKEEETGVAGMKIERKIDTSATQNPATVANMKRGLNYGSKKRKEGSFSCNGIKVLKMIKVNGIENQKERSTFSFYI
tara:strand:+ start:72 stop:353 length:282 start_codon:yes stop_codon:yes gene_type:complete